MAPGEAPVVLVVDERPGTPLAARIHDALAGGAVIVEALDRSSDTVLRAERERPAAIVMHLDEPRGFAAVRVLRRTATTADIPLILTTSRLNPEVFARHRELPTRADAYLVEPYDLADLRRALEGVCPDLARHLEPERADTVEQPLPIVEVVAETEHLLDPATPAGRPDFRPLHEVLERVERAAQPGVPGAGGAYASPVPSAAEIAAAAEALRAVAGAIASDPPSDPLSAARALELVVDAFTRTARALARVTTGGFAGDTSDEPRR